MIIIGGCIKGINAIKGIKGFNAAATNKYK
jgi:hypothetical protein